MAAITKLTEINFTTVFLGVFIFFTGLKSVYEISTWICYRLFKLELTSTRIKREEHDLLILTTERLNKLEKDLEKLTKMFIDKEVDDIRWEILDFASALSEGRNYSKEQFNHVLSIYSKYERILEDNNMENGLVTTSMEVINEIYKEKLKKGF